MQFYLSVGLPVLAILISLLIQLQALGSFRADVNRRRMDDFDKRMDGLERRMDGFEDTLSEMRTTFIKDRNQSIVRLESSVSRT